MNTKLEKKKLKWKCKPTKKEIWFAYYPPYPFKRTIALFSGGEKLGYTVQKNPIILRKENYRALSTEEIALIQGFPEDFKLPELYSKTVKLFGNAVSVPVIEAIGKALIKTGCFDREEL